MDRNGPCSVASTPLAAQALPHPVADRTSRLFEEHGDAIFGLCLSRLGNRQDAEDALQSTFMNAYRALERGVCPDLELPWLFAIANHVIANRRRSAGRRRKVETPSDLHVLAEVTGDAPVGTEDLVHLRAALASLSDRQRRAVLLREWQGFSYAEIARELDVSLGSVEQLLFRARASLAKALSGAKARGIQLGTLIFRLKEIGLGSAGVKIVTGVVAVTGGTLALSPAPQVHAVAAPPSITVAAGKPWAGTTLAPLEHMSARGDGAVAIAAAGPAPATGADYGVLPVADPGLLPTTQPVPDDPVGAAARPADVPITDSIADVPAATPDAPLVPLSADPQPDGAVADDAAGNRGLENTSQPGGGARDEHAADPLGQSDHVPGPPADPPGLAKKSDSPGPPQPVVDAGNQAAQPGDKAGPADPPPGLAKKDDSLETGNAPGIETAAASPGQSERARDASSAPQPADTPGPPTDPPPGIAKKDTNAEDSIAPGAETETGSPGQTEHAAPGLAKASADAAAATTPGQAESAIAPKEPAQDNEAPAHPEVPLGLANAPDDAVSLVAQGLVVQPPSSPGAPPGPAAKEADATVAEPSTPSSTPAPPDVHANAAASAVVQPDPPASTTANGTHGNSQATTTPDVTAPAPAAQPPAKQTPSGKSKK